MLYDDYDRKKFFKSAPHIRITGCACYGRKYLYACFLAIFLVLTAVQSYAQEKNATGFFYPTGSHDTGNYLGWLGYNSTRYPWHLAQDMKADYNAPVYAIDDGDVVESRSDVGGYGGLASDGTPLAGGAFVVKHKTRAGRTFYALYGHIKTDTLPGVGAHVLAGTVIARVGHYWYSDGSDVSHVHSGIMPDSLPSNPWRGYTDTYDQKHTNHFGFVNPWHDATLDGIFDQGFLDANQPSYNGAAQVGQRFSGDTSPVPAFVECYNRVGGGWIGQPFDAGGGPYVHSYYWDNSGTGVIQDFNGGSGSRGAILKHDTVGTAYHIQGEFWDKFNAVRQLIGWPFGDRQNAAPSPQGSIGSWQNFENGALYSRAPNNDTHEVHGGIKVKYNTLGGSPSVLGFPTSDQFTAAASPYGTAGDGERFEGGSIYASSRGVFPVSGSISLQYEALGGTASTYGFPVSDPYDGPYGKQQDFEGGTLRENQWIRGTGEATVHRVFRGARRAFISAKQFEDWGGNFSFVQEVPRPVVEQYTWNNPLAHLIQVSGQPDIYWIQDGLRRHIASFDLFNAMGFSVDDVVLVSAQRRDSYPGWNDLSTLEPYLIVMTGPTLAPAWQLYPGNTIPVSFTVRNITRDAVTVQGLTWSVRGPNGENFDFPITGSFTLNANEEFVYTGQRVLPTAGRYTYNEAFVINTDQWHQAIASGFAADTPGYFDVVDTPPVTGLTLSASSVVGGRQVTGTVTLRAAAPAGGIPVALSSNSVLAVAPTTVLIPAGATSAGFTINTTAVTANTTVLITANYRGAQTASLTLVPPTLTSVAVAASSVSGGSILQGTVSLSDPAPAGGLVVGLTSDSPRVIVPANVTVAAGATTATFTISTQAVAIKTDTVIRALLNGVTKTANLTLLPPNLISLTVTPANLAADGVGLATVALDASAPAGGIVITLSQNVLGLNMPAAVTVPAGASSVDFQVVARELSVSATDTLTASVNGIAKSATVAIAAYIPFDLNGDGYNDLILQNRNNGQIAFWFLHGAQVLGATTQVPAPAPGWKVVGAGDFNGDGKRDLLFQNATSGQLAVWYFNGVNYQGGDLISGTVAAGYSVVGIGDFNGDGQPDIAFQNVLTGRIAIWYMNGIRVVGGDLVAGSPVLGWLAVGTGDFNGDGKSDLVFQNGTTGQLVLWYLNGTSVIGGGTVAMIPAAGYTVHAVADYDGDGKPDLVFQNSTSSQVAIWFMNGLNRVGGDLLSIQPPATLNVAAPR